MGLKEKKKIRSSYGNFLRSRITIEMFRDFAFCFIFYFINSNSIVKIFYKSSR